MKDKRPCSTVLAIIDTAVNSSYTAVNSSYTAVNRSYTPF